MKTHFSPITSPRPSMQRRRNAQTYRRDLEQNLGDALQGNGGTPSDANRFVTEEGLKDTAQNFPYLLTNAGGIIYDNRGVPLTR